MANKGRRLFCKIERGDKNAKFNYTYDKEGRLIRKDMSDDVSSIYEYNERGLLSSLSHLKKNVKLEEYVYDYDLLGNKTKIVRHRDVNSEGIEENDNKEKICSGQAFL